MSFPGLANFVLSAFPRTAVPPFAVPPFIASALEDLFRKLAAEHHLRNVQQGIFAQRAAFYLGEINAVHPFRGGNGRAQREFIRQLAGQAGHTISWAGFTQEQIIVASILSHTRGDTTELASIIGAAIVPAEQLPEGSG